MRVLVEVAWGLPDWLEFFRGKRCEWFRVFRSWSAKHWLARAVFSDRIAHFVLLRVNMIVKVCWFCLCCAMYFTEMQTRRAQVSARVLRLLWFSAFLSLGTLTPTCILRAETTRKPHINIADLLFLSAQGGTEFNSLLAVWCSLFSSRWEDKLNVAQSKFYTWNSILDTWLGIF